MPNRAPHLHDRHRRSTADEGRPDAAAPVPRHRRVVRIRGVLACRERVLRHHPGRGAGPAVSPRRPGSSTATPRAGGSCSPASRSARGWRSSTGRSSTSRCAPSGATSTPRWPSCSGSSTATCWPWPRSCSSAARSATGSGDVGSTSSASSGSWWRPRCARSPRPRPAHRAARVPGRRRRPAHARRALAHPGVVPPRGPGPGDRHVGRALGGGGGDRPGARRVAGRHTPRGGGSSRSTCRCASRSSRSPGTPLPRAATPRSPGASTCPAPRSRWWRSVPPPTRSPPRPRPARPSCVAWVVAAAGSGVRRRREAHGIPAGSAGAVRVSHLLGRQRHDPARLRRARRRLALHRAPAPGGGVERAAGRAVRAADHPRPAAAVVAGRVAVGADRPPHPDDGRPAGLRGGRAAPARRRRGRDLVDACCRA